MFNLSARNILSGILLFPVFYALNLSVGPLLLDNLFKLGLLACLLAIVLNRPLVIDGFAIVLALRALKSLVVVQDPAIQLTNVLDCLRNLLSACVYQRFSQLGPRSSYIFLSWMTVITAIFSLPFLLRIVPELSSGYDLSIYGLEQSGFVGIFANPQNATITNALAALLLLDFIVNGRATKKKKRICVVLYALSVLTVYFTYVRIGWLIVGVGSSIIFSMSLIRQRRFDLLLAGAAVAAVVLMFLLSSPVFMGRILDTNIYIQEQTEGTLASGRFQFWSVALELFSSGSAIEQIFGIGRDSMMVFMSQHFGLFIVGHNGFVDSLVQHGLAGAALDIAYLTALAQRLLRTSSLLSVELRLSVLIAFFTVYLFQGGYFFYFDIYITAIAAICGSGGANGINLNKHREARRRRGAARSSTSVIASHPGER